MDTFIDAGLIEDQLKAGRSPDRGRVKAVLDKAREKKGLPPEDVAVLLNQADEDTWAEVFELARRIKMEIYGRRIVLFAPLYVANHCTNDCVYCGFRTSNDRVARKALTDDALREEVLALEQAGHKRLIMVYGEHPRYDVHYIASTIKTAYAIKTPDGKGEIRRVNVNAAPLDVDEYRILKDVGIGTFQVFQETYHPGRYAELHRSGKKRDYAWRLYALHRAQKGGVDDVGMGALFGLYDWRFEVMGLMYHALDMEREFGVGPHTISFPRLKAAENTPFAAESSPYAVSDRDFKRLVAVIRLAVPYTGMILTAREPPEVRREVIHLGVSQIDAGSRIGIGGYKQQEKEHLPDREQFNLHDTRSLDEVIRELADMDYIVSFCTSCYRAGRTGQHFMEYAKVGFINEFCMPNAVLTFNEYLLDYASEETRRAGRALIERELTRLPDSRREEVRKMLNEMAAGKRDLRF